MWTSHEKAILGLHFFLFFLIKINVFDTFWPWNWQYDLEDDIESPKQYNKWIVRSTSHEKEVLHMFLALLVRNDIFAYLTLKLIFWPWRWLWTIKIISEMDCSVKIIWTWDTTLVPSFICWKIIFDFEIDLWPWRYKNAQTFQAGTLRIWIQLSKIYKKHKKNIVYVAKQG